MTDKQKSKLFKIRCRCKQYGGVLSDEDLNFCKAMLKEFPEEYQKIGKEVFEATKPFGSF